MIFCGLYISHDHPPMNTAFMANIIANIGSKSDRPKSKVNVTIAALSCKWYFQIKILVDWYWA